MTPPFCYLSIAQDKMASTLSVAVVGAGVSGLSVASLLSNATRHTVTVFSDCFSPNTTSDKATVILMPYSLATNEDDEDALQYRESEQRWFKVTYDRFLSMNNGTNTADAGVSLIGGYLLSPVEEDEPWCKDTVLGFRRVPSSEAARAGIPLHPSMWYFQTFSTDGRAYLPWLARQVKQNGGNIVQKRIDSLDSLLGDFDVVVNCTGLGAKELVNDCTLVPYFGQTVTLAAPWIKHFILMHHQDEEKVTLVVPRVNDVVLGGVALRGRTPAVADPELSDSIIANVVKLVPSLSHGRRMEEWAGLRPCRSTIRLEKETKPSGTIIHNYGHGGNGYNYSWGCAEDVCKMVDEVCREKNGTADC